MINIVICLLLVESADANTEEIAEPVRPASNSSQQEDESRSVSRSSTPDVPLTKRRKVLNPFREGRSSNERKQAGGVNQELLLAIEQSNKQCMDAVKMISESQRDMMSELGNVIKAVIQQPQSTQQHTHDQRSNPAPADVGTYSSEQDEYSYLSQYRNL